MGDWLKKAAGLFFFICKRLVVVFEQSCEKKIEEAKSMVVVIRKKISRYISTTSSPYSFIFKRESLHLYYIPVKICFLNLTIYLFS